MMRQTLVSIAIVILVLIALVPSALAAEQDSNALSEGSAVEYLGSAVSQPSETQVEELTTDLSSTGSQEKNDVNVAATQMTSTGFYYPTDCHEYWNSGPGWLADDDENYLYHKYYHAGVDIYAPAGGNVYSVGDGEVVYIGEGWDSMVEDLQGIYIKHYTDKGQPFVSVYGHVRDDVDGISVGQTVTAGQLIGHVGGFDRTNGEPYGAAHVHFVISVSSDNSATGCGDIPLTHHQAYALVDPLNWIETVFPGPYPAAIAYDPKIAVTKDLKITQTGNTLTATFTIQNNGVEEVTLKELYVSGRYKYVSSTRGTLPSGEYPDFIKVKDLTLQPSATYTYTSCYVIPYTGDYEFFVMSVDSNGEKCWLIPKSDETISSRWFYANLFGTGSAVRSNPASISPGTNVPPGTGATVTPTLSWESVTGAEGYRIFISECDEKGSVTNAVIYRYPEIDGEPIQGTSFASIPEGILQPGRYYCWNFEPMIGGAWSGQYSPIRFFQTSSDAPVAQPKLHTDAATDITSTSAVLHGHLTNGEVGVTYPVCFRYEGGITQKTKTTATTVSIENSIYEFQLTGLEPETTYYYRAVHSESTGTEDPTLIDAASALSFTTPSGTSLIGSMQVNTDPSGASIYLDNVYQGSSPVTINSVAAGTHSVRATKSGYQERTRSVIVTAGQTSMVYVSLPLISPSGRTYTVGPSGCDFTKIQDAVYAAADWDRIEVMSGTYYENVIVNKSLTIQGRDTGGGRPTIDGQWFDTVIKIIADNVTFSNFEVINSKEYEYRQEYAGIDIRSHNVDIVNCVVKDNAYGIFIPSYYNGIAISSSDFKYNSHGGIYAYSNNLTIIDVNVDSSSKYDKCGIRLGSNNFLQSVTVSNCYCGISFGLNNTITNSEVRDNYYYGISGGSNNTLQNLHITNNDNAGITLSERNTLVNIAGESEIKIGSYNNLFNVTGTIGVVDNNTMTDIRGDLELSGLYNTVRNVEGSVNCRSSFNNINSIYGGFVIDGNRNKVSEIYSTDSVRIEGNENIIEGFRAPQVEIGGTRNQIRSFDLTFTYNGNGNYKHAYLAGSRNTLVDGKILDNGNYYTTGLLISGERATVQNVSIEKCGKAIDFSGSQYASIKNITVDNCSTGIHLGKTYSYSSSSSSNESISDIVMRNTYGISINEHSSPITIRNISIIGANGGLSISGCRDLSISNITIIGGNYDMGCINIWDSTNNTISDFKVVNSRTSSDMPEEWYYSQGILLSNSPKNTFQNGVISNFTNGISIQSSNLTELTNVAVYENQVGVSIHYSNGTRIQMMDNYHNTRSGLEMYTTDNTSVWLSNFINTNNTYLQNAKNTRWYSQNPIQYTFNGITRTNYLGNSWRGYSGIDADGDGIGDTTHVINQTEDRYPLVNYWQYYTGKTQSLPPSAGFVADATEGRDELTVQFTDNSAGSPTSWLWNFGDGVTSTVRNPGHTYSAPGYYNVTLTVENAWGSDSLIREGYIHVDTLRPYAYFTAVPVGGDAPLTVNFIDTSQYGPEEWYWTFGDGNTSIEQNPVHTYMVPGNYTVGLTASNDYGSTSISKTNYIHVTEPPIKTALSFDPATSALQMGEATGFNIVFDNAHNGLAGFNVTVALTNSSVGEIVGVSYPAWVNMPVNSSLPADSVFVQAVDLAQSVEVGATNVTLCTVFVRGDAAGGTNLTVTATIVDDDIGDRYAPVVIDATLTVQNILSFPNPAGGTFPTPTDPNGDGRYEDLDGNGFVGFNDVVIYYQNMGFIELNQPLAAFDYDGSGFIGFNDVVCLYQRV